MAGPLDERASVIEHGSVTVGLTAVLAQAANRQLRDWLGYNAGPGNIYPGTSAVTTANSIPMALADYLENECVDDLYLVSDQAGTVVKFVRSRVET